MTQCLLSVCLAVRLKGIGGNENVGCFYHALGLFIFVLFFCFSARKFRYFFQLYKLEKTAVLLVGVRLKTPGFRIVSVRKFRLYKLEKTAAWLVGVRLKTPCFQSFRFSVREKSGFPPRKNASYCSQIISQNSLLLL